MCHNFKILDLFNYKIDRPFTYKVFIQSALLPVQMSGSKVIAFLRSTEKVQKGSLQDNRTSVFCLDKLETKAGRLSLNTK